MKAMTYQQFIKCCLIGAGASFLGMAIICMLIHPEIFRHYEYGLSYFGSIAATFIPYYLGFTLTIVFVTMLGKRLWPISKPLGVAFYAFTACMTGVAATSYSLNQTVYAVHWAFAIALTICILAAIFWLMRQGDLARKDHVLIALIVITIIMSALPIIHDIPVAKIYILRELLIFICSLWLLGRAALRLSMKPTLDNRPLD